MDWIRRNWPDLLIGVALIAVIAGIVMTLLSGGSFLPLGGSGDDTTTPVTRPNDPVEDDLPPAIDLVGTDTDAADGSEASADEVDSATNEDSESGEEIIPVLPSFDSDDDAGQASDTSTDSSPGDGAANLADEANGTATDATVADASVDSNADSTSLASAGAELAPYRISVGAYNSQANAERRAQQVRGAGYPVFIGQEDSLYLVLVGPYESEGQAQTVAERIEDDGIEARPTIYEFRGDPATDAAPSTSATVSNASSNTSSSTDTNATSQGSAEETYIQVGAYNDVASSLPQRELLESLGYTVSEQEGGGLIRLWIGPFNGSELGAAQERLSSQGIEHFIPSQ